MQKGILTYSELTQSSLTDFQPSFQFPISISYSSLSFIFEYMKIYIEPLSFKQSTCLSSNCSTSKQLCTNRLGKDGPRARACATCPARHVRTRWSSQLLCLAGLAPATTAMGGVTQQTEYLSLYHSAFQINKQIF